MRRKIKPVRIGSHPSFFEKMEQMRKVYQKEGINLTQMQITNMLSRNIKIPNKINLLGVKNVCNKKKR